LPSLRVFPLTISVIVEPDAKAPAWKYWVFPLAFLAFWFPHSITDGSVVPDFNPTSILTSEAGLTFCMMTPVYLAILTLYYPRINMTTLRITSLVGVIIGFYNVLANFHIIRQSSMVERSHAYSFVNHICIRSSSFPQNRRERLFLCNPLKSKLKGKKLIYKRSKRKKDGDTGFTVQ